MPIRKSEVERIEGLRKWGLPVDDATVVAAVVTDKHHEKKCQHCGAIMYTRRSDTKFCSANCRKASARRASQIKNLKRDAIIAIRRMQEISGDDERLQGLVAVCLDEIQVKCVTRRDDT